MFDQNLCRATFTYSELDEQKSVVFKTHSKYLIFTEDNKQSVKDFFTFLVKVFPKCSKDLVPTNVKTQFDLLSLQTRLDDFATMNGFAMTHEKEVRIKTQELYIMHFLRAEK